MTLKIDLTFQVRYYSIDFEQTGFLSIYTQIGTLVDHGKRSHSMRPHDNVLGGAVLEVTNLSFGYSLGRQILVNINLSCQGGEVVHIKGSNGRGKSTFIKILAGLIRPQVGTLSWTDDQKVMMPFETCEYLAAEHNGLNDELTAMDNLRFWPSLKGAQVTDPLVLKVLERWGLSGKLIQSNLTIARFSTGMKRRLALARVCLSNSRIWLLDEPTYGLDTQGLSALKDMIQDHKGKGGLTLVVSHEPGELSKLFTNTVELAG
ncbi:MAG: heme ABC exporter ATP-binding protein CcmA [Pseudomonadota bacterium]